MLVKPKIYKPKSNIRCNAAYDFRCLLQHGPPLPIPNREVKPACADGTALLRVGE